MYLRKRTTIVVSCVTLAAAMFGLYWWWGWREAPQRKVPRLLRELRDSPSDRVRSSQLFSFARRRESIQADLDSLGPSAVPALIDALNDRGHPNPTLPGYADVIPNFAAEQLGKLRDRRAVEPLIRCLQERPVRVHYAFGALGAIEDPRAVDALIACLNDKGNGVPLGAIGALAKIGDRRAFEPLLTLLDNEDFKAEAHRDRPTALGVRVSAVSALGPLGDGRAFKILLRILESEEEAPEVREVAAIGLGQLGDRRAIPALTKAADSALKPISGAAKGVLYRWERNLPPNAEIPPQ